MTSASTKQFAKLLKKFWRELSADFYANWTLTFKRNALPESLVKLYLSKGLLDDIEKDDSEKESEPIYLTETEHILITKYKKEFDAWLKLTMKDNV